MSAQASKVFERAMKATTYEDPRALEYRPVRHALCPKLVDARPEWLLLLLLRVAAGRRRLGEHAEQHLGEPVVGELHEEFGVSVRQRGRREGERGRTASRQK